MKSKTGLAGFDWNDSEADLPMRDLYHTARNNRNGSRRYWTTRMKITTRSSFLAGALAMLFLIMAGTLPAQDKPADNMQIVLEKIKADKKLLIAQNMQLTEAESKTFWPVYEQYQNELFLLRMRTLQLIKDYGAAYENMTNSTAKNLIDEYITIETLRLRLGETYLPKFRNALSDVKVVRYYQIENKINAILAYELAKNIPLLKTSR